MLGHHLALALHDVDRHRRLAVLVGREFLGRADTGIGVLRGTIFSTMPPMVSIPSDSGVTSSSSVSEPTVSASA